MAKGNKKTRFLDIVVVIIAILVLIVLLGFIARMTNNFTDDFKTFYVSRDNNIYATLDDCTQYQGETAKYNVNYTFAGRNTNTNYFVKIVANTTAQTEFTYTVDGKDYKFTVSDTDYSKAFGVEVYDGYFTVTMPDTMQEVIESMHPDSAVTISDEVDLVKNSYFNIVVTSYNGKAQTVLRLKGLQPIFDFNGGKNILFY